MLRLDDNYFVENLIFSQFGDPVTVPTSNLHQNVGVMLSVELIDWYNII